MSVIRSTWSVAIEMRQPFATRFFRSEMTSVIRPPNNGGSVSVAIEMAPSSDSPAAPMFSVVN
jgi:hypothetical protein